MYSTIGEEQVRPYFQPIIGVDKSDVFAYEILGRICTPRGIETLGSFFHNPNISSHEKVMVDRLVRFKAMEQLKQKQRNEVLFLNIQPRWLLPYIDENDSFPTLQELTRIDLNGNQIVIELCEDEFEEENDVLLNLVQRYREAGCKIAIDDFGKGFSSLDRIVLLKPDYLKIGAGMIENNHNPEFGQYIMESLGMLCEKTGTSLILEEVETMDQFLMGLDAGVRFFQGHLFARPGSDFLESEFGYELIKTGLRSYIDQKTGQQLNIMKVSSAMDSFIRQKLVIPDQQNHINNIWERILKLSVDAPESWLRIYVCNYWGYQVTPNYKRNDQHRWLQETQYLGRNWCGRPYFLPRVVEARYRGKGILSQPYMDLETRLILLTFVFPLTEELFLFIDCHYNKNEMSADIEPGRFFY